jgi:23S rRNA (cytidine2498-2'-O)-methyltransferase
VFAVCQIGAETALKQEVAREWPHWRLSYSRPGFVTFKRTEVDQLAPDFDLRATFARTYGISLGRVTGHHSRAMAGEAWRTAHGRVIDALHIWQRDTLLPGQWGFEPGPTPLADELGNTLATARPEAQRVGTDLPVNRPVRAGGGVLDCVLVEPNEWWLGYHVATTTPSRFPGGVCVRPGRRDVISRAYWKMREALKWSRMPVARGDRCADIGCAPGGASQALLDMGLEVMGIDPADVDEGLLDHPRFRHVRKRAADVRRREFGEVRWLIVDSNVAPQHTLDTVEPIVSHRQVHVRGMLLTIKLGDWRLADSLPDYLNRIRSWGFRHVRARQLALNRREVCVSALRDRSMRRQPPRWKRRNEHGAGPC